MSQPLALLLFAVAGIVIGVCYFGALWWSVRRLGSGRPGWAAIGAILARFAILASVLALVTQAGALPLLATAAGVMVGRFAVLRRVRNLPA